MKNHAMPPAECIAPPKFSHRIRCETAMCIISIIRLLPTKSAYIFLITICGQKGDGNFMWKKIKPYVISIAIALGVGGLSALLTKDSMDIYSRIVQPPLAPPGWLFGVVWAILYVLMGISAAIVYTRTDTPEAQRRDALSVYALQLAVNFFWSILFFNLQAFWFSFFWLLLLWILILRMLFKFHAVSPIAAYLQIPYFLWVTFAAYLNLAIAILN